MMSFFSGMQKRDIVSDGEWKFVTAIADWKENPQFFLKFSGQEKSDGKIFIMKILRSAGDPTHKRRLLVEL
jgi:hypothetical protein